MIVLQVPKCLLSFQVNRDNILILFLRVIGLAQGFNNLFVGVKNFQLAPIWTNSKCFLVFLLQFLKFL